MTNRDKLLNMSLYDLLMKVNEYYDGYGCIIESLTDNYHYDDEKFRCFGSANREKCGKCIQEYLNEEN